MSGYISIRLNKRVLPDRTSRGGHSQNCFFMHLWEIRILKNALWFNKCTFGVPAFMEQVLLECRDFCRAHLDDVVVYFASWEEH